MTMSFNQSCNAEKEAIKVMRDGRFVGRDNGGFAAVVAVAFRGTSFMPERAEMACSNKRIEAIFVKMGGLLGRTIEPRL
jgi:hypothetical protein